MNKFTSLLVSLGFTYGMAAVGSYFTMSEILGWYSTLAKSPLNPPNWVFGPVWTILYALMAVAAWRVYTKGRRTKKIRDALALYALQLLVNTLWSLIFFGLHAPAAAFACLVVLWVLLVLTTVRFYNIDPVSSWLLAPYIAWVSFAGYLNLMVALLNQ